MSDTSIIINYIENITYFCFLSKIRIWWEIIEEYAAGVYFDLLV